MQSPLTVRLGMAPLAALLPLAPPRALVPARALSMLLQVALALTLILVQCQAMPSMLVPRLPL